MSYLTRFAKQNSTSFQLPIYPHSKTKEELGKIVQTDQDKFEQYVNPSVCQEDQQNVKHTEYGVEETFKDAKLKIESFAKKY